MFDNVLIMAGGAGTRLWPASSSRLPKQFLPAEKNTSFFDMALERALACLNKDGKVIIIAGKTHIPHVIECAKKLETQEKKRLLVIPEPAAKNTAPAIACAVVLSELSGSGNMLVLTSDHIIKPLSTFKKDAALAAKNTENAQDSSLVVFGIPVTRADTGYGYIEIDRTQNKDGIFKVSAFHEKPDTETASKYAKDKHFFWNSGMFAFNTQFMSHQFNKYSPSVIAPFKKLKYPEAKSFNSVKGIKVLDSWKGLEKAYKDTQSISFDYAIAEKCEKKAMVKTNFNWIDIGDWEEYAKINQNNASLVFEVPEDNKSAKSCYVDSDIPVALAGVEDLIVVIRSGRNGQPASALITRKGQTQKVKNAVELIKKAGKTELL